MPCSILPKPTGFSGEHLIALACRFKRHVNDIKCGHNKNMNTRADLIRDFAARAMQQAWLLAFACALFFMAADTALAGNAPTTQACDFRSLNDIVDGKLHVGYFLFPPYTLKEANGAVSGEWTSYVKKLLGNSNIEYTEAIYPAKRLASKLFEGSVQLTIVADNILLSSAEDKILFLPPPVTKIRVGLTSLENTPLHAVTDIKSRTLGVNRGYGYGGLIHELRQPALQLSLWPADSELQLVKLVLSQRLEAAILYESVLLKKQPDWNIDTRPLYFEPLSDTNFFVTLSRNMENLQQVQQSLTHNMALLDPTSANPCAIKNSR